jgi:RND superfamily putative drug exporter
VSIGRRIYRFRWFVVSIWVAAAGWLGLCVFPADPTVGETTDLLPANTPVHVALGELAKYFGERSGLSTVAVVFERADGPLSDADLAQIETVGRLIAQPSEGDIPAQELADVTVRTPASLAMAGTSNPLISQDRSAAIISMSLPYNYITKPAARVARHVQNVVAGFGLASGLSAAVTGSAGYGYDYAIAMERSHRKTSIVTLASVIVILLMVYRAPGAALIPLVGISIAAVVALKLLTLGEGFGVHSGSAEEIFTFVLLYSGGVDYSMLFMSRYREFLGEGRDAADSVALALDASLSAIASSAVMTVSGLAMLCVARFSIFRHAGPAVMLALVVAALAATTLVPAMLAIIGPRAFWPAKVGRPGPRGEDGPARGPVWPAIARLVVQRPRVIMAVTFGVLLLPALRGLNVPWSYDSLSSLKSNYQAPRGMEMAERHWPTGETAPVTVLAAADRPHAPDSWAAFCNRLIAGIQTVPDVDNIRGLAAPLGLHVKPVENAEVLLLAHDKAAAEFLSPDDRAMRLSVVLAVAPLSSAALEDVSKIAAAAGAAAANFDAHIHLTGASAEMVDIRDVTHRDFIRIALLALTVILIVVIAALRDVPLAIFMLGATLLSYFTTLGLTLWTFQLLGAHQLEWKVQMMLFIVLVAVGQDYSIFFAVRYEQEARRLARKEAVERALIFTGPVISSCGLIMAATLGSIMAGDIKLLVQLGFAFALGMLVDTFIVRPLLLPAFIVATGRTAGGRRIREN